MSLKYFLCFFSLTLFFTSCSEDKDVIIPRNLQQYLEVNSNSDLDEVVAFAASASGNSSLSYVFYYPLEGATEIRYYEIENTTDDESDFTNYRRKNLTNESIFGQKLRRFSRPGSEESFCIITFKTEGKLHKSDPIKLKIQNRSTEWKENVTVEFPSMLNPKFTWEDGMFNENIEYFQIISLEENEVGQEAFVSGTYTEEKIFQFYDATNTTSDINEGAIPALFVDEAYNIIIMGISEDNWVNLIIQQSFITRNLQEYLEANTDRVSDELIACAASADSNTSLSYIYYYPEIGATDIRIYETEDATVDETNFNNYRQKSHTSEAVFGGKLERYNRTSDTEAWCIVTYLTNGKIHTSEPIRLKNRTNPTEWTALVDIDQSETLKPKFTWDDGIYTDNVIYFQVISDSNNDFISGTYTEEKMFQFYEVSNVVLDINTTTPEDLVLETEYNFTMMGVSEDNWVNLFIQESFIAE
jgi:hypothetical protein